MGFYYLPVFNEDAAFSGDLGYEPGCFGLIGVYVLEAIYLLSCIHIDGIVDTLDPPSPYSGMGYPCGLGCLYLWYAYDLHIKAP